MLENKQSYYDFESVFDTLRLLEKKQDETITFDWKIAQVSKSKLLQSPNSEIIKTGWLFYIRKDAPSEIYRTVAHNVDNS